MVEPYYDDPSFEERSTTTAELKPATASAATLSTTMKALVYRAGQVCMGEQTTSRHSGAARNAATTPPNAGRTKPVALTGPISNGIGRSNGLFEVCSHFAATIRSCVRNNSLKTPRSIGPQGRLLNWTDPKEKQFAWLIQ